MVALTRRHSCLKDRAHREVLEHQVKILLLRAQVTVATATMLEHRHLFMDLQPHHYQLVVTDMTYLLAEMMNHLEGHLVLTDLTDLTAHEDLAVQGGRESESNRG